MAILVTGATGFIGQHVALRLRRETGMPVVAPVRRSRNAAACALLQRGGVILEDGLFYDREFVAGLFKKHAVTQVVHLAAVRGAGRSAAAYQAINIDATKMLLEESLRSGAGQFVFCSSVGVWGTVPVRVPPNERSEFVPDTPYHASKIEAERLVGVWRQKGLSTVIVRPTITYGAGDIGFPAQLVHLVRTRRFVLSLPDVKIHLVSVHAVAECITRMVQSGKAPDDLYVLLDREPVTLGRLADCMYRHFHNRSYPRFLRMPRAVFAVADWLCGRMGSDVWQVRMKLISRDWYYAPLGSYAKLCYSPPDTLDAFGRYLEEQWPAAGR